MESSEKSLYKSRSQSPIPLPDKEQGFFNSSTFALPVDEVFEFCQHPEYVEKILSDLPLNLENYLDLEFVSAEKKLDQYEIHWENKSDAKVQGRLSFYLKKAPFKRGTILTAVANFDKFKIKSDSSSDLMNIFLKRMKALAETGEIPTTTGQPSGREELRTLH